MTFRRVAPNAEYRTLRLRSDGGNWELGMSPYSHGMRLRMGLAGRPPRVIDLCLGRDPSLPSTVLLAVIAILDPIAEDLTPHAIDSLFPWAGTRPDLAVHLDPLLNQSRNIISLPNSGGTPPQEHEHLLESYP